VRFSKIVIVCSVVLICGGVLVTSAFAQKAQSAKDSGKAGEGKATADDPATGKPSAASLAGKFAGLVNDGIDDRSDYVPCFFSKRQLLQLQPKPASSALSGAEAEALKQNVINEALKPENAGGFNEAGHTAGLTPQDFAAEVGSTVFQGLTQSQALTRVLNILDRYTNPVTIAAEMAKSRKPTAEFVDDISQPAKSAKDQVTLALDNNQALASVRGSLNSKGQELLSADQSKTTTTKQNVANVARADLAITLRPIDVGCSMSILSYETTRKAFGETMADEYIGVQIALRNLNPDKEFLVQSAEFRVDDDINGRAGRYFSGVDKLTAREYMLASRDLGKRNLMINVVQGTGAVLSAVVPFTGPFVKEFSGVYSGALPGALTKIFPDHNTEQLKLIDDEGFSNSRTDRTVVPKSGTAEFVIFVSSKEFQEGWWTQECVSSIYVMNRPKKSTMPTKCIGNLNLLNPDTDPNCITMDDGIDLDAERAVCLKIQKDTKTVNADGDQPGFTYFKPSKKEYQHWSPQSLAIFREISLAVVAGTHIAESTDTTPSLTKIDCPVDAEGNVKLDAPKDEMIACSLAGTNLDKISQLKLRNSQNETDPKTATGDVSTVTTSGGTKTTSVSFAAKDLSALAGSAYKVYTETKDGIEAGGNLLLHFASTPSSAASSAPSLSSGPEPASIDLASLQAKDAKPLTIALKGAHLDQLSAVTFGVDGKFFSLQVQKPTTGSDARVSIALSDVEKVVAKDHQYTAAAPLKLTISLLAASSATPIVTKETLAFTGEIKSAVPPPVVGRKPKQPK
jgi:hypothetical protein